MIREERGAHCSGIGCRDDEWSDPGTHVKPFGEGVARHRLRRSRDALDVYRDLLLPQERDSLVPLIE